MNADSQEWKLSREADGRASLALSGDWLSPHELPGKILDGSYRAVTVRDAGIRKWNTALAVFLFKLTQECGEQSAELKMEGMPEGVLRLLSLSQAAPPKEFYQERRRLHFFDHLGEWAVSV